MFMAPLALAAALVTPTIPYHPDNDSNDEVLACVDLGLDVANTSSGNGLNLGRVLNLGGLLKLHDCGQADTTTVVVHKDAGN